jgi:hypothetical protein
LCCCGHDDGELLDALEDAGYFKQANEYCIAFVRADGSWDRFRTFTAENDDAANAYAEEHYAGRDWYVLDARGRNINGGDQERHPASTPPITSGRPPRPRLPASAVPLPTGW